MPAVHDVCLIVFRHIKESVFVVVQLQAHSLTVHEQASGAIIADIPCAGEIEFAVCLAVNHGVDCQPVCCLRTKIRDVDLSCHRFIAIEHRGRSFADLNGIHPRSRYIFHAKGLRETSDARCVFGKELDVRAA